MGFQNAGANALGLKILPVSVRRREKAQNPVPPILVPLLATATALVSRARTACRSLA
jgi:hypothetical protein